MQVEKLIYTGLMLTFCAPSSSATNKCAKRCHAFVTSQSSGKEREIPCESSEKVCPGVKYNGNTRIPSTPVSVTGEGWYLVKKSEGDVIALNVSWATMRDESAGPTQAYLVEIYKNYGWYTVFSQNFCLGERQSNNNSKDRFNFPCYGLGGQEEIKPGDFFEIMITPYPLSQSSSNHLGVRVQIPGCTDGRLKNVRQCVQRAQLKAQVNEYFCHNRSFSLSYNIPVVYGAPGNALFMGWQDVTRAKESALTPFELAVLSGSQEFGFQSDLPMSSSNYIVTVPPMYDLNLAKFEIQVFGSGPDVLRFVVDARFPNGCRFTFRKASRTTLSLTETTDEPSEDLDPILIVAGSLCGLVLVAALVYGFTNVSRKRPSSTKDITSKGIA